MFGWVVLIPSGVLDDALRFASPLTGGIRMTVAGAGA